MLAAHAEWQKGADLAAKCRLEPSGRHVLELELVGSAIPLNFTQDQAKWLRAACDEFLDACAFDDGRPVERTNAHAEPLMRGIHVGEVRR